MLRPQKQCHAHQPFLILALVFWTGCSFAAGPEICNDAAEQQWLEKTYADLFAKYDLLTVAQEFLDKVRQVQDLKERLSDCRKTSVASDTENCVVLQKQYAAGQVQRNLIQARFNNAIGMEQYLMTLKLKLARPRCGIAVE